MTQDNPTTPQSHYFSASPEVRSERHQFTLPSPRGDLHVMTESGVFSQRGLDKGTAVLLDTMRRHPMPPPPDGSSLCDLGCGSGAIALTLATTFPTCTVYAVDVNERARQLCAQNASTNEISNIVVVAPEQIDEHFHFARIWSNPPIRIGKTELHTLLETWLARLELTGRADIVVSKNLGADSLSHWIESLGYAVTRVASSKGFRVLDITSSL